MRTLPYHFDVTIPAGRTKANPLVTPTQFEPNVVDRVEWLFPPGCQGQVGIQIGARAIPIIPQPSTAFIVRSGDSAAYNLEDMHDTGDWSVIGYNVGVNPHTIQVTFFARRKEEDPKLDLMMPEQSGLLYVGVG